MDCFYATIQNINFVVINDLFHGIIVVAKSLTERSNYNFKHGNKIPILLQKEACMGGFFGLASLDKIFIIWT